jgi:hypothetical protein
MKTILILLPIIFLYSCKSDNKKQVVRQVNYSIKVTTLCDTLFNLEWDTTIYSVRNKLKRGQYFKLLDGLNFDNGEWIALIRIEHGFRWTWTDSNYFSMKGYYILTDKNILKSMQNSWTVKYLGADCCTDDFCIYFIRNNKFVLGTGIISDGEEGFQNSIYGYTPLKVGNTLRVFYKYFRPCKVDN